MKLTKMKKAGFTLIEILLVVGFISVAGLGVYTVYSKVQAGNAANSEGRNIDALRSGIKNLFAGQSNTTAITTAAVGNTLVNNADVTPQNMRTATITEIVNQWGGAVTVNRASLGGTDNGFSLTYPAVPGSVCTKLATGIGAQFDRVTVAGTIVKALGNNTVPNVATATAQCATDTGTGVTMIFESIK